MGDEDAPPRDIKELALSRELYIRNCDSKMAGNISSIFLTLIALNNLAANSFYYRDKIVNVFLEKMEGTITGKVNQLARQLKTSVMGNNVLARILLHILQDKFRRSPKEALQQFSDDEVQPLLHEIVQQKFEQRTLSDDYYDDYIAFLSGEQEGSMEISYTKQQQKQKQKQQNKNQDSDAMGIFDKKNQLHLTYDADNYYKYTLKHEKDMTKLVFNLPSPIPVLTIHYLLRGRPQIINVYPTLQFLYSHHINSSYITQEVKNFYGVSDKNHATKAYEGFWKLAMAGSTADAMEVDGADKANNDPIHKLRIRVTENKIQQSPQYTLAAIKQGCYMIGMKDQFNTQDLPGHSFSDRIQYIMDEVGFVLYDNTGSKNVEAFGPYFVENYIIMEVLSKQEVAQNVLDYYCNHIESLQHGLSNYDETQGKGFVCWRFLMNEAKKLAAAKAKISPSEKRKRSNEE